jgi:HK97 family phage major capsid protein
MEKPCIGTQFKRQAAIELLKSPEGGDPNLLEFSFSSEAPVERIFGTEILSQQDGAPDFSRIESGVAQYLWNHDRDVVLGRVERAWLAEGRGRCQVRWSPVTEMEGTVEHKRRLEIESGIVRGVSFAYSIDDIQEEADRTMLVTKWSVLEISSVTVPADATVGQGRAIAEPEVLAPKPEEVDNLMQESARNSGSDPSADIPMSQSVEPIKAEGPTAEEARAFAVQAERASASAVKTERDRATAIAAMGEKKGERELAQKLIAEGASLETAYAAFLEAGNGARKVEVSGVDHRADDAKIGMSERELSRYSLLNVANYLADPNPRTAERAAFELDASKAAQSKHERSANGVLIPWDVLSAPNYLRATSFQQTGIFADGGALVGSQRLDGSFIDLVRNRSAVLNAGVTMLSGLQGNVEIPKKLTSSTYYFVGEDQDVTGSKLTFGLVNMNPKTIGARVPISRRMMIQASPDIEVLVRADMAESLAIGIDYETLYGTGATNKPLGIINTTGIGAETLGGGISVVFPASLGGATANAGDWADYVGLESDIAANNLDVSSMKYLLNAPMRGALKQQLVASAAGSDFIYGADGMINGYEVIVSNQMRNNNVLFGNFADCIIGMWSGLDVVSDPYTQSAAGQVILTVHQDFDVAVRRAESFSLGS